LLTSKQSIIPFLKLYAECIQFILETSHTLSKLRNFKNTSNLSSFVMMSATWSWVLQWLKLTTLSLTNSRRKWNLISMCLLLLWRTGFLKSFMLELLSHRIVVHFSCTQPSFSKTLLNQTHWQTYKVATMYSTLVVDKLTTSYFLDDHDTAPELSMNTHPVVLLRSSTSPANHYLNRLWVVYNLFSCRKSPDSSFLSDI